MAACYHAVCFRPTEPDGLCLVRGNLLRCRHRFTLAVSLHARGLSNRQLEEDTGIAVGRYHRRALTRQQESIFNLELAVQKAPRGGLNPNRGFVELGAFRTRRLQRLPKIEMFKWNSISDQIRAESESEAPSRDRMRLAFYYQSLLDSGELSTRAELSRHLGVSRGRVTQVLNRLNETDDESAKRRFGDTG